MKTRVIVVAIIKNETGQYLLGKMPANHGIFPGQWGIVGGGIEEEENLQEALIREVWEETGLEIIESEPLYFSDDKKTKIFSDGTKEEQYLIYLRFKVLVKGEVKTNEEWEEFAWVSPSQLNQYDLNEATKETFQRLELL